ncbi:hypothetical protein OROGR_012574 [Orobanche gracilis]
MSTLSYDKECVVPESIFDMNFKVGLPNLLRRTGKSGRRSNPTPSLSVVSSFGARKATNTIVAEKGTEGCFASIASSGQQTSSVGASPQIPVPLSSSSQLGSPLFWIGVGVGFSALFSWKYAMEQAFKTFTQQMNTQNNPFANAQNNPFGNTQNNPFAPGSPFPFPPPPQTIPTSDSFKTGAPSFQTITSSPFKSGAASQSVTDVPVTKVEDPPSTSVKDKVEPDDAPKKYAFVDVSSEETVRKNAFKEDYKESSVQRDSPNNYSQSSQHVSQNGTASTQGAGASQGPSSVVLLICLTKVAKSAFDKALAEHEDIDDDVGSEEPTERDHGVDLQPPLLIEIDSSDSHQK